MTSPGRVDEGWIDGLQAAAPVSRSDKGVWDAGKTGKGTVESATVTVKLS
jgi:hypothetical protein